MSDTNQNPETTLEHLLSMGANTATPPAPVANGPVAVPAPPITGLVDDPEDDVLLLDDEDDDAPLAFSDEIAETLKEKWKILVVDDEDEVHRVTKLALSSFDFEGMGLEFHHAYSAEEAKQMLIDNEDYAMVLLDVVMETDHAGLDVVDFIRKELENMYIRIVLRTGQPGLAPESDVVRKYDIDDYKAKTELTVQKLQTSVVSSLRAYRELKRVDRLVQERTAELADVYRNLLDSINYAQRIQRAILPKRSDFQQHLPESFVFFQPKAIVSGDFYYLNHSKGVTVLSSVDCTGHGVPGAFMSMMGHNLMNQTLKDLPVPLPHQLLFQLDSRIQSTLRQDAHTKGDDLIADGMDVCVVVIQHQERELLFAGAHRPILYARGGEIFSIPGNRIPVGDPRIQDKVFDVHTLTIEPGDTFYLFTDGIVDQFGGDRGRKYTPRRFREFLLTICHLPMAEQNDRLLQEFLAWKGHREQTDDVCVIGFRPVPAPPVAEG